MKRPLGIVLSLLLTLAGCSGGETASALPQAAEGTLSLAPDQPVHLAVVAGEAANSPTHDYTGEVLSSLLTTLCRQGGHLTLVEADGAPYLLYSEAVAAPDASLTENKQDQIVQAQVTQDAGDLGLRGRLDQTRQNHLLKGPITPSGVPQPQTGVDPVQNVPQQARALGGHHRISADRI